MYNLYMRNIYIFLYRLFVMINLLFIVEEIPPLFLQELFMQVMNKVRTLFSYFVDCLNTQVSLWYCNTVYTMYWVSSIECFFMWGQITIDCVFASPCMCMWGVSVCLSLFVGLSVCCLCLCVRACVCLCLCVCLYVCLYYPVVKYLVGLYKLDLLSKLNNHNYEVFIILSCCFLFIVGIIKACISTWCFSGIEEWSLILDKLSKDMAQYLQQWLIFLLILKSVHYFSNSFSQNVILLAPILQWNVGNNYNFSFTLVFYIIIFIYNRTWNVVYMNLSSFTVDFT